MEKINIEEIKQLLSYRLLMEHGSPLLVDHVTKMLDDYKFSHAGEGKVKGWIVRNTATEDSDDERRLDNKFKKIIIYADDDNISRELHIANDFDINNSLYSNYPDGDALNLVTYIETKSRSLSSDGIKEVFNVVVNKKDLSRPTLVTKIGTLFRKVLGEKKVENVDILEQPQNE